jgi:urease accessory protein
MATATDDLRLLRLLQLVSPSLPVGSFAYSQGIEWAAEAGWVRQGEDLERWLADALAGTLARVDLPVLLRQQRAWGAGDADTVARWGRFLVAGRETAELRAEESHRARALAALLPHLGVSCPPTAAEALVSCQAAGCALAAASWDLGPRETLLGYAWAWLEGQVLAAVKALPLGQTVGQRVLSGLGPLIAEATDLALGLGDEDLGGSLPALAIASSRHETQYTRLFRS